MSLLRHFSSSSVMELKPDQREKTRQGGQFVDASQSSLESRQALPHLPPRLSPADSSSGIESGVVPWEYHRSRLSLPTSAYQHSYSYSLLGLAPSPSLAEPGNNLAELARAASELDMTSDQSSSSLEQSSTDSAPGNSTSELSEAFKQASDSGSTTSEQGSTTFSDSPSQAVLAAALGADAGPDVTGSQLYCLFPKGQNMGMRHLKPEPLESTATRIPVAMPGCPGWDPDQDARCPLEKFVFGWPAANLAERYLVSNEVLGSGRFGVVRECRDRLSGRRLACKSIRKLKLGRDLGAEEQAERLRVEAGMLIELKGHENIVELHEVLEDEEEVHLVMDLCEGRDLFDEIASLRQGMAEPDAAHVFAQLLRAVAACHARGVVHRDLKPENVLLTWQTQPACSGFYSVVATVAVRHSTVKLIDFGLAARLAPGSKIGGATGSRLYAAPEVLTCQYDAKADMWSLGVILYMLISGAHPFGGSSAKSIHVAELDFSSWVWGQVSRDAKSLVRSLLRQDPTRRPSANDALAHPWILRHYAC